MAHNYNHCAVPMSILFEVIDTTCQQADQSFFPPAVSMTTKSTSKIATVLGYSEFTNPSVPPKKYRTVTFSGSSSRVAFTAEATQRQCGGAQFVYGGVGQIDLTGNQTSKYSKKFFSQCSKQYWPPEPLQLNDHAINTEGIGGISNQFVGFCFPTVPASCPVCDPDSNNWAFIGDQATNNLTADLTGFMHGVNDPVVTQTSWSLNDVFQGLTSVSLDEFAGELFGTDSDNYNVVVGSNVLVGRALVTTPGTLSFPAVAIKDSTGTFINGQYIVFTDTNNYSAVLSDEYTDADALDNAKIVVGTGKVADNLPRTSGFTSVTTTVDFTLNCTNLINGRNYTATVQFVDVGTSTVTTKQYPFTASGPTQTITDTIPTPAVGHSTQVKNPQIKFVP